METQDHVETRPPIVTKPPAKKVEETWLYYYWRPAIAWQYFIVCLFDFIIFPLLTAGFAAYIGIDYIPWDPITLKESGFYHMSMGAIIGVASWTRGQEKVKRMHYDYGDRYYDDYEYNYQSESQVPVDRPLMRRKRNNAR